MFQIQHDWGSDDSCWFSFGSSSSSSNNDARTVHARLSFENGRPKAFDSERFALTQNASTSLFHVRDEVSNCEVDVQRASSSFKIGSNVLTCLDVNTAGELGVVGDEAGNLSIFDANDGTVRHSLPNAHLLDVNRVSFFPSGQVVLTCGGDMLLKVWDALEGVLACTLKGHRAGVLSQCIIDRGRNVVSASRDGSVKLWEISSQQCVRSFDMGAAINDCATDSVAPPSADYYAQAAARSGEHFQNGQVVLCCSESASLHLVDLRIDRPQVGATSSADDRGAALVACALNVGIARAYAGSTNGWLSEFDLRSFSRSINANRFAIGSINSMCTRSSDSLVVGASDGVAYVVATSTLATTRLLTGADLMPLYATSNNRSIFTAASRVNTVNKYVL